MLNNSDLILVAGATGGVGQLVVAKLLEKNLSVRALTRNQDKAQQMFDNKVDIVVGDIRYPDTLRTATKDVTHIICCTGTTAFPSQRWDFANLFDPKNTPQAVDGEGVKNLILATPKNLKRFVFVSSCGVLRKDKLPFNILNTFGVLDAKLYAENTLKSSGLPYTIIRPGRLIDGPYTSYDLNTLLRAKTDGKKAVVLGTGDTLNGETSRIDVANVCVECLNYDVTINQAIDIINSGVRPAVIDWKQLFNSIM
ncbi:unknown [Crocosphaera subtropica ATCC 51142]|uniref:NAD(P)-binding domain-containing protein n=1 Tax=Crocosphaera subtropica (strain ATCC 51142 / BH68) TaxID=43989 RepID=B1X2W0_CROS5|nr:SDR family oxidoreductase [Crocosphaera subtropica]ACB54471.1 unknown [Crocosphaera subtropica ATCC 51142]